MAGKDASKQFWKYHNEGILKKYKGQLQIGSLDSKKAAAPLSLPAAPPAAQSSSKTKALTDAKPAKSEAALDPYGDLIPFADPAWYQGVSSPDFQIPVSSICAEFADGGKILSTIHHTSMRLMRPSAKKFVSGSNRKSSPMLRSGMKPRRFQTTSTSRWVKEAT